MEIFNGILNNVKRGTYKNDLVAANQDYLGLDSSIIMSNNSIMEFNVFIHLLAVNQPWISNNTTSVYSTIFTNGDLYFEVNGQAQSVPLGITTGLNQITFRRSAGGLNFVSLNGGGELALNLVTNAFELLTVSRRTINFNNLDFNNFEINGIKFPLDEANGVVFFGDDGITKGTRFTSHASGLQYINNVMINRIG